MKKILSFMVLVCSLYSCSSMPNEKVVTVSNVEITGFIKDYVKVVDGNYMFTNDGKQAFITVKFELIKNLETDACRKKHPEDIRINPMSDTGDIFDTGNDAFTTSRSETAKFKNFLNNGKIGDTKSISFIWGHFGAKRNKKIAELIFTKAANFEVIDDTFNYCNELTESDTHWDDMTDSVKTSSAMGSGGNTNWDKVLDEYENYIDSYVKLFKRASSGDMTAMADYPSMLTKAESLSDKLSKAKGSMSASQLKRYVNLQTKITSIMQ